ncbi:MAG: ABC-2 family transporter protein [Finegoldia sp.]|nr:ABC-2 family transporter protein [Finegoldia sp.]
MKILKASFKIKRREFAAYRNNIYLNFIFGCVPILLSILLWKVIYGPSQKFVGGYTYKEMITYYILAFLLSCILNSRENTVHIADMIQNGEIHNYILKPINFFSLNFKLFRAEKLIYLLNISIPFIIFCILLRKTS